MNSLHQRFESVPNYALWDKIWPETKAATNKLSSLVYPGHFFHSSVKCREIVDEKKTFR